MADDKRLVRSGLRTHIKYAERANGAMEAKEWLEQQDDSIKAGFDVLFKRMADFGKIHNKEQFRHLDGEIWEFKKKANRILTFSVSNTWYLTHHYPKGGQKCPPKQIKRANTIRIEFLKILAAENKNAKSKPTR
jgi:hypothetical protein